MGLTLEGLNFSNNINLKEKSIFIVAPDER